MQERVDRGPARLSVPENLNSKVGQLREFKERHGLKGALFDLDNTLSDTTPVFDRQERRFVEKCLTKLGREVNEDAIAEAFKTFHEERDRLYTIYGFDFKTLWPYAAEAFVKKYSQDKIDLGDCLVELEDILITKPAPLPGALETLDIFAFAGFKRGLVTHASDKWTAFKLEALGIEDRFDHITLAPINRLKGPDDWKAAVDGLGILPEEAIAIGDSVIGDIQAANTAGIRFLVHVPPNSHYFGRGELPQGALTSLGIGNVVDVLLGMRKAEKINV